MPAYHIALKNEKLRSYYRISWLIIIINSLVFLYLSIFSGYKNIRVIAILYLALLALYFFLRYYFRNTKWQIGIHPFFFFLIMGWIGMEEYWLAAIPFIFDLLAAVAVRKLSVVVEADKIVYPSFPAKTINWSDLVNIVLKDGLLTLNFKNNHFIQQFVDEAKTSVNEKEFNDFCNQQLKQ
ncbi:MAG: hypothetical protein ABI688_09670 [Bacteroidota bacterium]